MTAIYGRSRAWSTRPPVAIAQGPVWRGNQPGGLTLVTDQPFTTLPSNNCAGFFTQGIVDDSPSPQSTPKVWECFFPAGWSGLAGDSPGLVESSFTAYKRIYMSMYVKYSSNWQGHATGVNKIIHWWLGGTNRLFLLGDGSGANPLLCGIGIQGAVSSPFGTSAQVQPTIVGGAHFTRGSWDLLEMDAMCNTNATADGSVDLWLNGVKVSHVDTIQWTAGASTIDLLKLDPTWGGQSLPDVTNDMYIHVDHMYVAGTN